jgi:DNA polymerase-3 subunit gamma/tau
LRVKFYIIDEAHMLTPAAFNAFLKTLEEPPPHVKFVLATTDPDKLPDTIASRCQRFDFHRIPLASAVARLRTICEREGLEVEEDALQLIARQSTGSLRDAEGLLDQLALYRDAEGSSLVTADTVRQLLGLSRNERMIELVDALAARDAGAGLRLIADAAEGGEDVHQLNRQFVGYLRLLLHLRAGGRDAEADDEARRQADLFTLHDLVRFTQAFSSIEGAINRGSFAQLPLEIAFVEAVLPPAVSTVTVPQAPAQPERPASAPPESRSVECPRSAEPRPAPSYDAPPTPPTPIRSPNRQGSSINLPPVSDEERAPARQAAPATSPVPGSPALERLVASWTQIRRDVKTANARIAALLASADPTVVRETEVVLVSPYEFHRNKLNEDGARRVVEDVISRHMGGAYQLICVDPSDSRSQVRPSAVPASEPTATNGVHNEPEAPALAPASDPAPAEDPRLRAAKAIFDASEDDE